MLNEIDNFINCYFDETHYSDQWLQNDGGDYYEVREYSLDYMLINNREFAKENSVIGVNLVDPSNIVYFTDGPDQASGVNRYYNNNDYYDDYDVHVEDAQPYGTIQSANGTIYIPPVFGGPQENAVHDLFKGMSTYDVISPEKGMSTYDVISHEDEISPEEAAALDRYAKQHGLNTSSAVRNLNCVKEKYNEDQQCSEGQDPNEDVRFGFD